MLRTILKKLLKKEMEPKMAIETISLDQLATIIISIALIVSAFLAVHLNEAIYAVGSLACTLILLAILYWIYQSIFAAIFQLVTGISTLMVLFLAGEMLSEKTAERVTRKQILIAVIIGLIIAVPLIISLFFTATSTTPLASTGTFTSDIWSARSIDIVLQGLVILVIAVGVAIVLYQKKVEAAVVKKTE